jgi:uncharacterized Zn finger protein (UPF0148 family)
MFKQIKKPGKTKPGVVIVADEQITCGACGHVRQESDHNPEWQCPNCEVAYAKVKVKVEKKHSKQELRARNREYLRAKSTTNEQSTVKDDIPGWMNGVLVGIGAMITGVGSACAAANPVVLGAGALVVVGSIAYALFKIFS